MAKKKRRYRRRPPEKHSDLFDTPDIEHCVVATRGADLPLHNKLRDLFWSGKWWILFGFESEKLVERTLTNLYGDGNNATRLSWPVARQGENTGVRTDAVVLLFLAKSDWTPERLRAELQKTGTRSNLGELANGRDVMPISRGYMITLMNFLNELLKHGSHHNN